MQQLTSFFGLLAMLLLAWLFSENRRRMDLRLIASGVALQLAVGIVLLRTGAGRRAMAGARDFFQRLIDFSDAGATMVFGQDLVSEKARLAFSMVPSIIFFSSLMAVLFHFGIMQRVTRLMARVMVRVMDTSGSESLSAAANVFLGMTTAPLVVRPYIETMTRSELMAMMTTGMATVAANMMAVYVTLGIDAGHVLTASLMSAPAALVIAKVMVPETEDSPTLGIVKIDIPRQDRNALDAACRGASEGLTLGLSVVAMLIAFVALVAMLNWTLTLLPQVAGAPLSLERVLGWLLAPVAWALGVEWKDAPAVGMLLGKKTILNEFVAYLDLAQLQQTQSLSPRSVIIATYALCGFANFGSVAIMIGGLGSLVPGRRDDLARYGLAALVGGTLAAFMTAAIAGMLIPGP